jgi:hypothetical protein
MEQLLTWWALPNQLLAIAYAVGLLPGPTPSGTPKRKRNASAYRPQNCYIVPLYWRRLRQLSPFLPHFHETHLRSFRNAAACWYYRGSSPDYPYYQHHPDQQH